MIKQLVFVFLCLVLMQHDLFADEPRLQFGPAANAQAIQTCAWLRKRPLNESEKRDNEFRKQRWIQQCNHINMNNSSSCNGTQIGELCFGPLSPIRMNYESAEDYCDGLGLKVPRMRELRYAAQNLNAANCMLPWVGGVWSSDPLQYNRNFEDELMAVVSYASGGLTNHGPNSASSCNRVLCVDHLIGQNTPEKIYTIKVNTNRIPIADQKQALWCWAAVAQMIFAMNNQQVAQAQIVSQAFTNSNGETSMKANELVSRLRKMGISLTHQDKVQHRGVKHEVFRDGRWQKMQKAKLPGTDNLDIKTLLADLHNGVFYVAFYGISASTAHAVLLIGLDVSINPAPAQCAGNRPCDMDYLSPWRHHEVEMKQLYILNPWPGTGLQTISADDTQLLDFWRVNL